MFKNVLNDQELFQTSAIILKVKQSRPGFLEHNVKIYSFEYQVQTKFVYINVGTAQQNKDESGSETLPDFLSNHFVQQEDVSPNLSGNCNQIKRKQQYHKQNFA